MAHVEQSRVGNTPHRYGRSRAVSSTVGLLGVAAILLGLVTGCAGTDRRGQTSMLKVGGVTKSSGTPSGPDTSSANSGSSASGPSGTCQVDAPGTTPQANGGGASYPPAEAPPANTAPMSETDAVSVARAEAARFGGTPAAPSSASSAAEEMSYSSFLTLSGWGASPSINPQRCVWVVSIHAPIAEKPAPGAPARTHSEYTVVLDVGSGSMIGLIEGEALAG